MIPAAFDYQAPTSIEDALALLGGAGDSEVKVLAGGQSLLPVLRLRLAAPDLVIDLGKIDGLTGVSQDGDTIVFGAMTTHHEVATNALVAEHLALLHEAAKSVADPQVRHRGTFGGALVHADPAGDLLAPALALDAEMVIAGASGTRTVPAAEFFSGLFSTAVGDDEILTQIRIPSHAGWGARYEKFTRVSQQWSIVAVAATVRVDGGSIAEAAVALTNMGSTPVRATAVEQALVGVAASSSGAASGAAAATAVAAAVVSVADGTTPPTDLNGDADYRRHLAGVLTRRAVLAAAGAA
ncbi:MAG: xanthine dehydrogenase family protein subunit M [Actinomycetota bacterium]|nr:xanthine dehydrogenase family protein subunit M [Actinomycetota bacterium]